MTKKVNEETIQSNEEVANYMPTSTENEIGSDYPKEQKLVDNINTLIHAIETAQSKGAFNLEQSSDLWRAITELTKIFSTYQVTLQ